jgi:putative ABC transport system permease protein
MSFLNLIWHNLRARLTRVVLTSCAVGVGIMTVVALGVLTFSLRETAVSILRAGTSDFTIAQEGVSDLIYSAVDERDLATVRSYDEVESAIGVLIDVEDLDRDHPLFLVLGLEPATLEDFGVRVVSGTAPASDARDDIMLGFRVAADLGKEAGDQLTVGNDVYTITGLFSTGQVYGDTAAMRPLRAVQADERKPGAMSLLFVRTTRSADIDALRTRIEQALPQLATVRSESDFGRVDRNLELIKAANAGGSVLALAIGAIGVMNTTLLSFFERTREFGVLRAIGWSRRRLLALVFGEALAMALAGAMVGVLFGWVVVQLLAELPALAGIFEPQLHAGVFWRALGFATTMTLIGAFYPAIRAARLTPLKALSHE